MPQSQLKTFSSILNGLTLKDMARCAFGSPDAGRVAAIRLQMQGLSLYGHN